MSRTAGKGRASLPATLAFGQRGGKYPPGTAVYPGSFDPVTRGHLDLIERACRLFERVIVAVTNNATKRHTFSVDERIRMLEESLKNYPQVEIDTFSGLLVDYLRSKKTRIIIRGLRAMSDLDYEFQMAAMNRHLYPQAETVFLMPDEKYTYLSSSVVKEVARTGTPLDAFVPAAVNKRLSRMGSARPRQGKRK